MAARAARIGVTTYGRAGGRYSLPAEYVDSVRRAGGLPLLLAPGEGRLGEWLDGIDALVLAGGGDLDPRRYGGRAHDSIYDVDEERDGTELELVRGLLASKLPTFAICRGMQVLNVALGGTLIEHLPDESDGATAHRGPERAAVRHGVSIAGDSLLGAVSPALEVQTFSKHHQALRTLGRDLAVVARAPDGVVEGVQHAAHPWLLAVQWHPELSSAEDPTQQALFDALVREAERRRA